MDISVIIPVYKGGNTIRELFTKIRKTLEPHYEFEILFIEDSGNNTNLNEIASLIDENPKYIRGYNLENNYGQHKAILFGFSKARAQFIVTIDEDLQHDPGDILKLINEQNEGNYDVVYGKFIDLKHNIFRNFISLIFRNVIKFLIPYLYFDYSPYRLIKKATANEVLNLITPYVFIDDYLSRITSNISSVNIQHHKRLSGKSSITFFKLFWNGILIILVYSRIITYLFILAIILIFAGLLSYFINQSNTIFTSVRFEYLRLYSAIFSMGFLVAFLGFAGLIIKHYSTKANTTTILYDEIK